MSRERPKGRHRTLSFAGKYGAAADSALESTDVHFHLIPQRLMAEQRALGKESTLTTNDGHLTFYRNAGVIRLIE